MSWVKMSAAETGIRSISTITFTSFDRCWITIQFETQYSNWFRPYVALGNFSIVSFLMFSLSFLCVSYRPAHTLPILLSFFKCTIINLHLLWYRKNHENICMLGFTFNFRLAAVESKSTGMISKNQLFARSILSFTLSKISLIWRIIKSQ